MQKITRVTLGRKQKIESTYERKLRAEFKFDFHIMSGAGFEKFDDFKQRRLITQLQSVGHMVAKVVPNALYDAFGEDIFNVISCSDVSNQTTTQLLKCTSQVKATISGTIQALNLFEKCLENQSQETGRLLQQWFCRAKSAYNEFEPLSREKVESPLYNQIKSAKMPTNKANEFENVYEEYLNDQQHKNDSCQLTKELLLQKQFESLQIEHEETLFQLGKFSVEEDAKRKKKENLKYSVKYTVARHPKQIDLLYLPKMTDQMMARLVIQNPVFH